jgi:hypothetical protein
MSKPAPIMRALWHSPRAMAIAVSLALISAMCAGWWARPAVAVEKAEAAQRPPLSIVLLVSSRSDRCYDRGDIAAINRLTALEVQRLNRAGKIAGRSLQLRVLDDARDEARSIDNLRSALADPQTLAIVGLSNSNRAKATFDALGKEIRDSGIPFLSRISVNKIFENAPNVYTTRASQDDERVPAMAEFVRQMGFSRTAFVGLEGSVFSNGLGDGLGKAIGQGGLVADHRLAYKGQTLAPDGVAALLADLKAKGPDLVVLSVGSSRTAALMKQMAAIGVTPALFVTGRIESIPAETTDAWPNAIYQLTWDRLPEADSERVRRLISRGTAKDWVFDGRKVAEAPGWASGECKVRPEDAIPDPMASDNLRAIATGSEYADMVGLVAAAARTGGPNADIPTLRRSVLTQLRTTYAAGRGAFKGSFEGWSFQPKSRAAVRTPFIVILPRGLGRTQLAPMQLVRLRNNSLRRIDTLYIDIDLIRLHRVEDNEKTFYAEFYLSMRDNGSASVSQLDFTNAYLDPRTNGRQLTVEELHGGGASAAFPESMKIYRVSGRFTFEPDLANYPFDTQRFSIDLQPKGGGQPFIVQPPPLQLRDKVVVTDGWDQVSQYVGYDEDFVPIVDAYTHEPSVVPFYRASFAWLLKRQATDYYLRVVVPLAFILIVAYLSIFIPLSHFEAIVTIQVTALLSAVALYLSLPKLDADTATLSDRIFVFDYMMVSLMIVISILLVNGFVAKRKWLKAMLVMVHVLSVPAMLGAMAWYVYGLSLAE